MSFRDLTALLAHLGFEKRRTRGSHHLFARPGVMEMINIQNVKGQVKPYQVRQLLRLVDEYNLSIEETG